MGGTEQLPGPLTSPDGPPQPQPQLQQYSYMQPSFVDFYDEMVDTVYGGIHSQDMLVFTALLDQRLRDKAINPTSSNSGSEKQLTIVDLGCGSGRLVLALLHHVLNSWGLQAVGQQLEQQRQQQAPAHQGKHHLRLRIFGFDDSRPMLERAAAKVQSLLDQHPDLKASTHITWVQSPFQTLDVPALKDTDASKNSSSQGSDSACVRSGDQSSPSAGSASGRADLMLMAAGGLHHVCTTAEVRESLVRMRRHLAPDGIIALGYLTWEELLREDSADAGAVNTEAFRVGHYQRQRLHYKVDTHADGSQTVYERFRLSTLGPDGAVLASIEEDWCLRRLDREELLQLAHAAGLAEVDASCVPTAALQKQEEGKFMFLQMQSVGS